MNKKVLILFTTVSFIFFTNLFLLKSSARTKIHNNYLFFTGVHNVSFTVKRHCISPKQPYATPDGNQAGSVKNGKIVGINIRAGRHGSKNTVNCTSANLFDNTTTFKSNFTFTHKGAPKKLNFAVKGTLAINGKYFDDIILAQGHHGPHNNWWFGGNQCQKKSNVNVSMEQVECTAKDGTKWCFIRGYVPVQNRNAPDHVAVETRQCVN